jgi:hypothetical protein
MIKMETEQNTEEVQNRLDRFLDRWNKKIEREGIIVNWHMELFVATGVDLPWSSERTSMYVNVYGENDDEGNSVVDEEATLKVIAKVVQFASSKGHGIEKKYDDEDFRAVITLGEGITVSYIANRKVVCTPTVVGQKFIAAVVLPAQTVDIIEWECDKLSFMAIDTSDE